MSDAPPSSLFVAQLARLREAASVGPVLDLACGRGRHALVAAAAGLPVVGLDRDAESLAALRDTARERGLDVDLARADFEAGASLPLRPGCCGAILVFRYLYRPLVPEIVAALRPGGLLLYETFSLRQRELGWGPRRAAFLLRPGELAALFSELEIVEHWEGRTDDERPAEVGRLVARRP